MEKAKNKAIHHVKAGAYKNHEYAKKVQLTLKNHEIDSIIKTK